MNRLKGILMIIIGAMFWGATGPMMEYMLSKTNMTAEFMLSVRLLIAGPLLLLLLSIQKQNIWAIWQQSIWRNQLLIFSVVGMLGLQFTFVKSIEASNAVVATLLQFLAPIFIIFYVALIHKKWPPNKQLIGIIGTLFGLFLLLTNGSLSTLLVSNEALIWGLFLGLTYAFYTLYPARMMAEWGVLVVVAWGMLLSGSVLAVTGRIWLSNDWSLLVHPPIFWMMVALVILGASAFVLFLSSMKYISAVETSVLSSFEPLTAMIISVFWFGSVMQSWQLLGMLLMLVFVAYLSIAGEKGGKA
ncbi:DMT family transporter [Solibacillus sp. CAU 1738]|uniref:DMT family transporter n=1 Tax=Solibacillus sp. CAU 1738 TaxID=3140363 RepID=UPI0032606B7D